MQKKISLSPEISKKYQFHSQGKYFSHFAKNNDFDRVEVEIGDAKQPDFKPQIKIKRWDNEVNFSLRAEEDLTATIETKGEKIVYKHKDYDVEMFDKPEAGEDGGLEFQWVLNKKPKTNVLTATIQTKELDFFYQPEITDEEAQLLAELENISIFEAKRKIRPENVVGSYAIYHKIKQGNIVGGKEYKTGKAFHIYRPHIDDAEGKSTWGELGINENTGLLSVTIPQDFLDRAVYPVVVDPTFGYETIGSSSQATASYLSGSVFTSPSDMGSVNSISIGCNATGTSSAVKGVIVLHSNLNIITNGISNAVGGTGTPAFQTTTFSSAPTISPSTEYVLCGIGNSTGRVRYDTGGTSNQGHEDTSNNYESVSNPTDASHNDNRYSVYITYTASASTVSSVNNSIANMRSVPGQWAKSNIIPATVTITKTNSSKSNIVTHNNYINNIKSSIKTVNSKINSTKSNFGFNVNLVSPLNASSINNGTPFVWTIPSRSDGKSIVFMIQIDGTDETYSNIILSKVSSQDFGFEYWNGSSWETIPQGGVISDYYGNQARYTPNLSSGTYYWRVKPGVV